MMVDVTELPPDRIEEEGWERRSILDEPRLSEVVATYEAMGLEVMLRDVGNSDVDGCTTCLDGSKGRYMIVYTRPGVGSSELDELFSGAEGNE